MRDEKERNIPFRIFDIAFCDLEFFSINLPQLERFADVISSIKPFAPVGHIRLELLLEFLPVLMRLLRGEPVDYKSSE
jgi:hypothetical protein